MLPWPGPMEQQPACVYQVFRACEEEVTAAENRKQRQLEQRLKETEKKHGS